MNDDLDEAILGGNVRAAARLMRLIDDRQPEAHRLLATLLPHTGNAYVLGVTGNPGSGKSTLVSQLIGRFRDRNQTVGCIAIDPTSPFSGGAILGDRVRMQHHADDDGVFIRSVATRGNLGGLSRSTPALVQVMDAMGYDVIIVETVGVGQDEVEIVRLADTSIVVLVPGLGDDIQADKAGLMEIADIFVLNKSDLAGSQRLKREIQSMLSLHRLADGDSRRPPVQSTDATRGDGVDELFQLIADHRQRTAHHVDDDARRKKRHAHLVRAIARTQLDLRFHEHTESSRFDTLIDEVADGELDPYRAADRLTGWLSE